MIVNRTLCVFSCCNPNKKTDLNECIAKEEEKLVSVGLAKC